MLKDLYKGFHSLVFPPRCYLCQTHTDSTFYQGILCACCRQILQENYPPFCIKCSRHLAGPLRTNRCKSCEVNRPFFDFAWSCLVLNEPLKKLIHLFKYQQRTALRHLFGRLMAEFIREYHLDIHQFDMLVPIPLLSSRIRERGFNQSLLLAREISQTFLLPVNDNILLKARLTKNQVELGQKERWTNMEGAFRIKNLQRTKNKNILIVDDLLTTGATVSAAAQALKSAGAHSVGALTLAVTA